MVTLKIIENVLSVEEKKDVKLTSFAYRNALKTLKIVLNDTKDLEKANPLTLKKIIESTFNIG
jgi:hypothetical protein